MKKEKSKKGEIIIYKTLTGPKLEVRLEKDTIWMTQAQIAELFGSERTVITKHLNNVFKDGELQEKSNVQKIHIANSDKLVKFYDLDAIISVGYRVNSSRATQDEFSNIRTTLTEFKDGFAGLSQSRNRRQEDSM